MMKTILAVALFAAVCLVSGPGLAAISPSTMDVAVQPEHIQIGAGYNGATVSVSGIVPDDAVVLIRLIGKTEHTKLKQKGRALGFLWMNLGSVEISNNPSVFLLFLPQTADAAQTAKLVADLGLGIEEVRRRTEIVADGEDKDLLFHEFTKLKAHAGLYKTVEDAVRFRQKEGGSKSFQAVLALPAAIPQGDYRLEVIAIRNNAVVGRVDRKIDVREVGMPAWIASLAFDHGALYGLLAVVVAVAAGLLTGFLFKGGKGAH